MLFQKKYLGDLGEHRNGSGNPLAQPCLGNLELHCLHSLIGHLPGVVRHSNSLCLPEEKQALLALSLVHF